MTPDHRPDPAGTDGPLPAGLSRASRLGGPGRRAAAVELVGGQARTAADLATDLAGWLPGGGLAELAGRGRLSLALATVRAAQDAGRPVAWIDGSRTFCPSTAGVDLEALTYVCPEQRRRPLGDALFAADVLLRSRAFALVVLDLPGRGGGLLSAWFRLGRLARRAGAQLLVLHDQPRRLTGSAATLALRVRLRPTPGPPWADLPPPALEIEVLRRRGAADPVPS